MADSHSHAPATTEPHDPHAPPANAHEIAHHINLYWKIGGILALFTCITVGLAYVDFDKMFGGHGWNMKIGMVVASFKVSLVGAIFMHLKEEKATIWRFLYFTAFFVMGLFLLFWLAYGDPIFGTEHFQH
jgi:caa(3)-type oxidase subunit IV